MKEVFAFLLMSMGLGILIVWANKGETLYFVVSFALFGSGIELLISTKMKELHEKIRIEVAGMIDGESQF